MQQQTIGVHKATHAMDCDLAISQAAMIELLQKRIAYLEKQFNTTSKAQSKLLDESLERIGFLEQQLQQQHPAAKYETRARPARPELVLDNLSPFASPQKRQLLPSDSEGDEDDGAIVKKKRANDVCCLWFWFRAIIQSVNV